MEGANVKGEEEFFFFFFFFFKVYSSTRTLSPAISGHFTRGMKLRIKLLAQALYEEAANENKSMIYDFLKYSMEW